PGPGRDRQIATQGTVRPQRGREDIPSPLRGRRAATAEQGESQADAGAGPQAGGTRGEMESHPRGLPRPRRQEGREKKDGAETGVSCGIGPPRQHPIQSFGGTKSAMKSCDEWSAV